MWHTIFHIYGPFAIHSYGLAIAIGLIIVTYLIKRDPRFKELSLTDEKLTKIILVCVGAGLLGGRILFLSTNREHATSILDLFTLWQGGLSILGAVLAIAAVLPWYLYRVGVPVIGMLDLVGIYAPLLQSISRVGCFLAGCCYGLPTTRPWGIIYTDTQSEAPLYLCLHPAQLYSAIGLMLIFAFMYFIAQKKFRTPGQLVTLYVMLISIERFIVDFWRGDQEPSALFPDTFSLYQYISAGMFIGAGILFVITTLRKRTS